MKVGGVIERITGSKNYLIGQADGPGWANLLASSRIVAGLRIDHNRQLFDHSQDILGANLYTKFAAGAFSSIYLG